ncbi:MAG: hypothetical protein ABMA64_39555 [Myxococcota bacterium]
MTICDHFDWSDLYFTDTLTGDTGLSKVFVLVWSGTKARVVALGAHADATFTPHTPGVLRDYDFNHPSDSVFDHLAIAASSSFALSDEQKVLIRLKKKTGGGDLVVQIWLDQANGWKIQKMQG